MAISRDIDLTERRDFKPIYKKLRVGAPWVKRHQFMYNPNDIITASINSTMSSTRTSFNISAVNSVNSSLIYTNITSSDGSTITYTTPRSISTLLPWVNERKYIFNNIKIPWLSNLRVYDRCRIDWKQTINIRKQLKRIAWGR